MARKERDISYNHARNPASSSCCRLASQTFPYSLEDQKFSALFAVG